jgi:hypothetical protein
MFHNLGQPSVAKDCEKKVDGSSTLCRETRPDGVGGLLVSLPSSTRSAPSDIIRCPCKGLSPSLNPACGSYTRPLG